MTGYSDLTIAVCKSVKKIAPQVLMPRGNISSTVNTTQHPV